MFYYIKQFNNLTIITLNNFINYTNNQDTMQPLLMCYFYLNVYEHFDLEKLQRLS